MSHGHNMKMSLNFILLTNAHISTWAHSNYRTASQETGRGNCCLITSQNWRSCWSCESSGDKFTLCLLTLLTDSKTSWGHLKEPAWWENSLSLSDVCARGRAHTHTHTHIHALLQVYEPAAELVWRREMIPRRLYIKVVKKKRNKNKTAHKDWTSRSTDI